MKKCCSCRTVKEESEYYRNRSTKDGYCSRCKPCAKGIINKEKAATARKEYEKRGYVREYRLAYRRQRKALDKVRVYRQRPEVKARRAFLSRERRKKDPKFALHGRVSCMIRSRIRASKQGRTWARLLPYSIDDLMRHLERQFLPRMGWHNMGEWEIDHIVPQSAFTFSSPKDADFKACWAMTNLRPLWSAENESKKDKRIYLL